MEILYKVHNNLYVNLTNKCTESGNPTDCGWKESRLWKK